MKKTLLTIFVTAFISTSHAQTAEGSEQSMTQSVFDNIILRDISNTQNAIQSLQQAIQNQADNTTRSTTIDTEFTHVISTWKAVQAAYIVGELDSDMIDTPRLMDTYHEGNEKLDQQIARAVASGDEPRVALFKNTFKSINALAILLYSDKQLSPTERQYATYILTTLNQHLSTIKTAYMTQQSAFNKHPDKSMSYLLNALIDSAFKLKEWRVGEAAGLAKKYSGSPDNRRQEYLLSGNSLAAAKAIVGVHDDMMGQREYVNLGSTAIQQGAKKEVMAIRELIHQAQQQITALENDKVSDFSDPRIKTLYQTLSELNDAYYQSLVKALPVQAKILDADGD